MKYKSRIITALVYSKGCKFTSLCTTNLFKCDRRNIFWNKPFVKVSPLNIGYNLMNTKPSRSDDFSVFSGDPVQSMIIMRIGPESVRKKVR